MIEVLVIIALLGIAVCVWSSFWVVMLDRMAIAKEHALGYAYARSYMAHFRIENDLHSFVNDDFEITIDRFRRFGRFYKVVLEVKGKRDTFYIHTGMCE